jgi:hypothetical protein
VAVRTASVSFPWAEFLFEVFVFLSAPPFSAVVSDAMGVELFLLARTVSGSGAALRFESALFLHVVNGSPGRCVVYSRGR